ncbi:hypothetical protein Acr_02g0013870 [Actinidia rufa]|uniref:X8 domain-containing protein n=1 Tax=Actinidia rufa TaxID=165716 RepID=A0A7J0EBX0_9ERIC|nr:hypothetical protein Acr_02g0013870 [Actinidia rufa]
MWRGEGGRGARGWQRRSQGRKIGPLEDAEAVDRRERVSWRCGGEKAGRGTRGGRRLESEEEDRAGGRRGGCRSKGGRGARGGRRWSQRRKIGPVEGAEAVDRRLEKGGGRCCEGIGAGGGMQGGEGGGGVLAFVSLGARGRKVILSCVVKYMMVSLLCGLDLLGILISSSQELVEQLTLHDPCPVILQSLSHSGVSVAISVGNEHLHELLCRHFLSSPRNCLCLASIGRRVTHLVAVQLRTYRFERVWCVAKPSVPAEKLQEAMDYACGDGGADCEVIRPQRSCYSPDTVVAHWQKNKSVGGTCSFGGTAMLINAEALSLLTLILGSFMHNLND